MVVGSVAVSGGRLAYHRTGGSGPVVVMSHGLTDNGLCWSRLATALAAEFDLVMLDARGHGESSRIAVGQPHDPAQDIAEAVTINPVIRPVLIPNAGHNTRRENFPAYLAAVRDFMLEG